MPNSPAAAAAANSPRSMPLRSALRDDSERTPPLSGLTKAVQIAEPDVTDVVEPPPVEDPPHRKQFPANVAKRLGGRAAVLPVPSSARNSIGSQISLEGLATYMASPAQLPADDPRLPVSPLMRPHASPLQPLHNQPPLSHHGHHSHHHQHRHRTIDQVSGRLLAQVAEWLQHERAKKEARKSRWVRSTSRKNKSPPALEGGAGAGTSTGGSRAPAGKAAHTSESAVARNEDEGEDADADADADAEVDADAGHRGLVAHQHQSHHHHHRAPSTGSASSEVSLDRLQRILDDSVAALGVESLASYVSGLRASVGGGGGGGGLGSSSSSIRRASRTLRYQPSRTASSDTEYFDGDVLVPGCDALLDNTKTLKYTTAGSAGVGAAASDAGSLSGRREDKERHAWATFKNEIIRLAHTLRLKGWRKVPLDAGETITVERLSGALTNAVYVVSPPAELDASQAGAAPPPGTGGGGGSSSSSAAAAQRGRPNKLLLRIYGPQVEHLIDREKELSVLRRLARKKIGPRLLGTFGNGRFEQFFTATTLTAANLREPATSVQIAKRMRELHDGVELLEEERDGGPAVWLNWDRWLDNVEAAITFLDNEVRRAQQAQAPEQHDGGAASPSGSAFIDTWKTRGFVCGVEWPVFRALLDKHRDVVKSYYGSTRKLRDRLVFAHNDTQYGNILRLRPDERSPLLHPENEHKQLIVIDFEYAAANPPGVEFANHFTEWTYNYHDSVAAHNCVTQRYPTPEQQRRFIAAYVDHRPEFPHQSASSTPRFGPLSLPPLVASSSSEQQQQQQPQPQPQQQPPPPAAATVPPALLTASSSSSIVDFMLDARAPPGGWVEEEKRHDELLARQVDELMEETQLWRAANSAMWVAWGIVQAKIPGFSLKKDKAAAPAAAAGGGDDAGPADEDEPEADKDEEFDYLGYAQERAFFVLGDCVRMGLVALDALPADVQARVKMVGY